jgi:hypothetical protein
VQRAECSSQHARRATGARSVPCACATAHCVARTGEASISATVADRPAACATQAEQIHVVRERRGACNHRAQDCCVQHSTRSIGC